MEISFENLNSCDLAIDCIYKGGSNKNISADPLNKLMKCGNSGGFRNRLREDKNGKGKYAYIVLYTSLEDLEWPDYMDVETGIFRYYGDNKKSGRMLTNTAHRGNLILEKVFNILNSGIGLDEIPPFFIFCKCNCGRDVKFLGLAAPGNPNLTPDNDLVAFWRTSKNERFQNYEAYFTVLDTGNQPISREWLDELVKDHATALEHAPKVWKEFIKKGRKGIKALKANRIHEIPNIYDQLQSDNEGKLCLESIRNHYAKFGPNKTPFFQGFEYCAKDIVQKMDKHFIQFDLTRPWRDGGRDAIGIYSISSSKVNFPLKMDCSLEAKCYSENHGVGVKEMSRLISRIRYRQFGILVTTSYVNKQAYREIIEDGHPILVVTAADIANILRRNSIYNYDIDDWLNDLDRKNNFLKDYF